MSNNDLAIRFTETNYCSKSEVSKELKMSLIDNIWNNILTYRSNFYYYLNIKTVEQNQLFICNCPTINGKIASIDAKLLKLAMLSIRNATLKINDNLIEKTKSLLIHKFSDIWQKYIEAERFAGQNSLFNVFSIDFLSQITSIIFGNDNVLSLYRSNDSNENKNAYLIDKVSTCAPSSMIEDMMNNLFGFLQNCQLSNVSKSFVAYYYINYVKPFDKYNQEIALLYSKAILSSTLGEVGAYLPVEEILFDYQENIDKLFAETQKTTDITYVINFLSQLLETRLDNLLNEFASNQPFNTAVEIAQKEEPKPIEKEIIKVEEVKIEKPKPVVESKPVETKVEERPIKDIVKEHNTVVIKPTYLDEKTVARMAENLMELDPLLKKSEARFYAKHCTIGKSYSIEQFKKDSKCVYETARTSMEHLVKLGYYKKDIVNNKKFVYTPIERK